MGSQSGAGLDHRLRGPERRTGRAWRPARRNYNVCAMAWTCTCFILSTGTRSALRLALTGFTLLSVGNLVPLKGHDIAISALPMLPGCTTAHCREWARALTILSALLQTLKVADRVTFLGSLATSFTEKLLRCSGCAGAGFQPRRLGQCAAGIHGMRYASHREQCLGDAGSRCRARSRHADDEQNTERPCICS